MLILPDLRWLRLQPAFTAPGAQRLGCVRDCRVPKQELLDSFRPRSLDLCSHLARAIPDAKPEILQPGDEALAGAVDVLLESAERAPHDLVWLRVRTRDVFARRPV
jgi:hypothetical protein